jgi:predicted dehydrogenase
VDWGERTKNAFNSLPKAKRYKDYRRMFDQQKDIEAVVISTPDHTHAVIAIEAMRRGLHVYCEKPLAHSLYEVRALQEMAEKSGVVTQMGNQGHTTREMQEGVRILRNGELGEIREILAWSDRLSSRFSATGEERPSDTPPVPETLDWDLWLGPAPYRPYHPRYLPQGWRSWVDFGNGAVADIGCHTLDIAWTGLELGSPVSVEANTTFYSSKAQKETFPVASIIRFDFPARGNNPPVTLTWHDGFLLPETPPELRSRADLGLNGTLIIGDKAVMIHGFGGNDLQVLEKNKKVDESYVPIGKGFPDSPHYKDWVDACKTGKQASSNFGVGGPLTEVMLVGSVATRIRNAKLEWDSKNLRFTNNEEANTLVNPPYREGWSL